MNDFKPFSKKKCYACTQWDGVRSLEQKDKGIKVDVGSEGMCRVHHTKVKGSHTCPEFYPLR